MNGSDSGSRPGDPGAGEELEPIQERSTTELLQELKTDVLAISKAQIELAKAELKETVEREVRLVAGLGVGGVCALIFVNLLLVALIFGLANYLPGWLAALIVAAAVAAIGCAAIAFGWSRRVRRPFQRTRRSLKEDARWVRERTT
jgi:uncharacterized membrane protein YqjE